MNTRIKWLAFGAYALTWSLFLYFGKLDTPISIYLKIFFPICLINVYYVLREKNHDWRIAFDKLAKFIGKVIVLASLPALFILAAFLLFLPYLLSFWFYSKLGIQERWAFPLALITPTSLILASGSIYKKIKGKPHGNGLN